MKRNMGTTDRILRVSLAVVFAMLYFAGIVTGVPGIMLLILAGIFLVTSLVRFCPLYLPFGISTAGNKS